MRSCTSLSIRLVAAMIALHALAARGLAQTTASPSGWPEPVHIGVTGNDYAFVKFPATIAAGRTLFSFANEGHVRHELSIALLRPGITPQQAMEAMPDSAAKVALLRGSSVIGILIARPGDSSGGELFVDLKAGRTYAVICTLKDTPIAPPHVNLGMYTSFVPR